jgi:hypothetical protein
MDKPGDIQAFPGRELAALRLSHETLKPYCKVKIIGEEKGNFIIDKIRFAKSASRRPYYTTRPSL